MITSRDYMICEAMLNPISQENGKSITKKEYKNMKKWFKKKPKKNEYDSCFIGMPYWEEAFGGAPTKTPEQIQKNKLKALEKRVRQMECEHEEWEYKHNWNGEPFKRCKHCEKGFLIKEEPWLQEQADLHYEKHVGFIDQINELNEQKEEK